MTDKWLAEELELSVKDAEQYGFHSIVLMNEDAKKIIAALRRSETQPDENEPERPSSGDFVMVPREATAAMVDAGMDQLAEDFSVSGDEGLCKVYRAMLSAAEAEGRKG